MFHRNCPKSVSPACSHSQLVSVGTYIICVTPKGATARERAARASQIPKGSFHALVLMVAS